MCWTFPNTDIADKPKKSEKSNFHLVTPFALAHAVTLLLGVLGTDLPSVDISVHGAISATASCSTSAIALCEARKHWSFRVESLGKSVGGGAFTHGKNKEGLLTDHTNWFLKAN